MLQKDVSHTGVGMNMPSTNEWLLRMRSYVSAKIGQAITAQLRGEGMSPTVYTTISELQYMVSTGVVVVMNGYLPRSHRLKEAVMLASIATACRRVLESFDSSENKTFDSPQLIVADVSEMLWRNRFIFIMLDISPAQGMVLAFPAVRSYVPTTNKYHP